MINEPLKFDPILKDKIWGGKKLNILLDKRSNSFNIGESWEISDVNNDVSIVSEGAFKGKTLPYLINKYKDYLVGKNIYNKFGNKFPLLIKFIDAKEPLSIQLHPNDTLAKKKHNSFGKTEMWYVIQADKKSELIVGFSKKVSEEMYKEYLSKNKILKILNVEKVDKGDVFFIPTGRVHAIGSGVLLAEIQQTSDITYRIYDWERKDDEGNFRELHTSEALNSLDFKVQENYKTMYDRVDNESSLILSCPFFTTNIVIIDGIINIDHSKKDSFIIYMCVSGNVIFANSDFEMKLKFGETILIPNCLNKFKITSDVKSELLEIYID